jgi:hypothetical protein
MAIIKKMALFSYKLEQINSIYGEYHMPRTASITSQALAGLGLSSLVINTIDNPNAFDTSEFDDFGWSVAIDGDRAIVGAYREDDAGGTISGKAYIFNTSTGVLVHTLNNPNAYSAQFDPNPTLNDQFGYSVAISGNRAIVGAPGEDEASVSNSGKAYIFDVTTGEEVHTLDNPNAFNTPDNDRFGIRVGISGNYAIASAYNEDDAGGVNSGKAYIFDVTTGNLLHTLDNPDPDGASQDDNFGNSIGISGDYAIVGAPGENDGANDYSGNAYIFDATDGSLVHTLTNPNPVDNSSFDRFGDAVAISGNRAIVGARTEDGSVVSTDEGKAYIYDVITGQLLHTLDNPDTVNGVSDDFGYSVAISGNFAIVGTPLVGITSGIVYIFNASTGTLIHTIDNPNAYGTPTADRFGESVAISGNRAIVSAYGEDELDNLSSGKAYLLGIPNIPPLDEQVILPQEIGDNPLFSVDTTGWTTSGTGTATHNGDGTVTVVDTSDGDDYIFYVETALGAGTYKVWANAGLETGNGARLYYANAANPLSSTQSGIVSNRYNEMPEAAWLTVTTPITLRFGVICQVGGGVTLNGCGLLRVA